ncbi:hypothetical protein BH20VER3_BH20VER3_00790 [soil metagenome]
MAEQTKPTSSCRVCLAGNATFPDPQLGPVCVGCYADLVIVRGILNEIGPRAGLAGCGDPRISASGGLVEGAAQ